MSAARDDVQVWRDTVKRLTDELRDAEAHLAEAVVASAEFHVGDEVEARIDRVYVDAVVLRVQAEWGTVRYYVGLRKKDGTWSKRERGVFDFGWPPIRVKASA